jgi:serine/threonine protein kinase
MATETTTGRSVAVKALHLGRLEDWKILELFERETRVLKDLDHEFIPDYIDSFTTGEGNELRYILVQEYVQGVNLREKVGRGWRGSEDEISAIAVKLLRILSHIHNLKPPIVHRDINPKNVIQRVDGEIFLVDFGGVQDSIRAETDSGSTVVGTPGYMPLEQFVGRATPRSDLFAAASTILFLLSHKDPSDLPSEGMKVDLKPFVNPSSPLYAVLDRYLEPDERMRTLSLERAIRILEGEEAPEKEHRPLPVVPREKPHGSRIRVVESPGSLSLIIPEKGQPAQTAILGTFSTIWLTFVGFWTFLSITMGAPFIFPLFSVPFWLVGLYMMYRVLYGLFGHVRIDLSVEEGFHYETALFGWKRQISVPLVEAGACEIRTVATQNRAQQNACQMELGVKRVSFAANLSEREKKWLQSVLNDRLERFQTAGADSG